MIINKIVKLLRKEAEKYEKATMMLPVEMITVINGEKQEKELEYINTAKVIRYVADMLEE